MSKEWRRTLLFLLLIGAIATSGAAQMKAITQGGQVVLLYPDGTWRYDYGNNGNDDYSWGRGDTQVNIDAGATGKRFGAMIDGRLYFIINDGALEDFYIYDEHGFVAYSLRDGIERVPYNWTIQYDIGNERRIRKLGPYEFKYDWRTGQLEKVGSYQIEYHFHNNKVERIGQYRIDYDFRTERLSQFGNIRINYDFMTDGIESITGQEERVMLYLLRG